MKDFKKSDLSNGMVIEQRRGTRKIVIGDRIVGYEDYGELQHYGDDLLHQNQPGLDIIRVYNPISTLAEIKRVNYYDEIWERPEVKEVTMAEVEEKFGCRVKIVKE